MLYKNHILRWKYEGWALEIHQWIRRQLLELATEISHRPDSLRALIHIC
jgi:hypothetical protein